MSGSTILPWSAELGRLQEQLRRELWDGSGCAVVRGFPIRDSSREEASAAYRATAETLGRVVPQTVSGVELYSVRDEGVQLQRDYGKAGVRTSKTTAAFGFHTDSPSRLAGHTPDVIGLFVLQTAKSGGASVFADGRAIYNAIAKERPDYLDRLCRPFWVDRRAELPPGEDPILPVPVFTQDTDFRVRYLRLYIEKGQEVAGETLTVAEIEALDYFDLVAARFATMVRLEQGDMQFLNNSTNLHGRSAYEDYAEPERKRHYLRIWMEANSLM